MVAIYYVLALMVWLFGAVFLLFLSLKTKYRRSIPARFFLYKNAKFAPSKVHFHACSFGEIQALKPILELFNDKAISVVTNTGYEAAKKITRNSRFLPFEIFIPFWLQKSKILVVFEAELWLMLVFWAKFQGSRVILINARISDRSYERYLKFAFFYRVIFKYIDRVYAQSQIDKERLSTLGAREILVCGNIKSAFLPKPSKIYEKPKERVIVLASTHEGEEAALLNGLNLGVNDKLIIAPRHPERFGEVANLAAKFATKGGLSFAKFSQSQNLGAQVNLIDSLGELVNIYAISDVVVLGGSFMPGIGGHNPIEAAQFEPVLISGKHIFNQKALFSLVSDVKFASADEVEKLINSELKRCKIMQKGDVSQIIEDIRSAYE
ncbi:MULTISPECIES: lipid IV(A) 3-deoxy-D-manno-octulosonic acid transferase [Campylobacter]|uniref:lipid IV(A) 3-deoxy-D-manno-octulosonic acid transferase n=1 Tax=Campylobacter TaxID=194 RepID=UPI00027A35FC|nr:lipid IV(A) 3-deoxy-D-manno-octulosonic acid transferase [Campylobacter sp. FOBRC14]EJP74491.1 3-deoxy-D-manno-octulosonic-acid transferase [Campylobacter sp. FOBRC14]